MFTSGYGHGNIQIFLQLAHVSNARSSVNPAVSPNETRMMSELHTIYSPWYHHKKSHDIVTVTPLYVIIYHCVSIYHIIKYVPLYTSPLNPHQIPITHFPWSNPLFSDRKKSWHPQSPRRSLLAVLHICTRLDQTLEHLDIARENGTWRQAGPHGVSSVVRIISWIIVFNGLV